MGYLSCMRKLLSLLLILMFSFTVSQAQTLRAQDDKKKNEQKGFSWDKVVFDGGGGLWFGSNIRFVDLYPSLGYKLTKYYMVGLGFRYMYYFEKYEVLAYDPVTQQLYRTGIVKSFDVSIYGPRVFNRYYITENFFAHAEYEVLSFRYIDYPRRLVGSPLVGGGYSSKGNRANWYILLLYNLNEHVFSPYPNPLIRVGASIGF